MKKFVLLSLMLICVGIAKAQWTFTPEVGMNITKYEDGDISKIGARLGVAVEYQLPQSEFFSIKSGLYFIQRRGGSQYNNYDQLYGYSNGGYYGGSYGYGSYYPGIHYPGYSSSGENGERAYLLNGEMNKNYIQLPVLANFSWKICDDVKINAGVGPYIAYGISGRSSYTVLSDYSEQGFSPNTTSVDSFGKTTLPYGDGTTYKVDGYKRFDWGLTATAGIEIKRIAINLGYDMGLGKRRPQSSFDLNPKFHTVSLSVGYAF